MSETIDEKVVEMRFDNTNFRKNVQNSIKDIDDLKRSLNFKEETGEFRELEDSMDKVSMKFSALGAVAFGALSSIGSNAANAAQNLIQSFTTDNIRAGGSAYDELTIATATMVAQGQKVEQVNESMDKLKWFADETSYSLTSMANGMKQFIGTGRGLEESRQALEGIASWAALAGVNMQAFNSAVYQLSQAMSKGALKGDDFRSVLQNGMGSLPQFKKMAIEAAKAAGDLREEIQDGVTWYVTKDGHGFNETSFFNNYLSDNWLSADSLNNVLIQFSSAADEIQRVQDEMGFDTASEAVKHLKKVGHACSDVALDAFEAAYAARTLGQALESVKTASSTKFSNIYAAIFGDSEQAQDFFTDLSEILWDMFVGPINDISEAFTAWAELNDGAEAQAFRDALLSILESMAEIKGAISEGFLKGLGFDAENAGEGIAKLTRIIVKFIEMLKPSESLLEGLRDLGKGLGKVIGLIRDVIVTILTPVKTLFGYLADAKKEANDGAIFSAIGNILSAIVDFIQHTKILVAVGKVLKAVFKAIAKVIGAAATAINSAMGIISDSFGEDAIPEVLNNIADALAEIIEMSADLLVNAGPAIKKFFTNIGEFFKGFKKYLNDHDFGKFFNSIGKAFTSLWDAAKDTIIKMVDKLANMEYDKIAAGFKKVATIALVLVGAFFLLSKGIKIFDSLGTKFGSFKIWEILKTFSEIGTAIGETIETLRHSIQLRQVTAIAKSILMLAISIRLLADVPADKLVYSLSAITILMGELIAAFKLTSAKDDAPKIISSAKALITIAFSVMMVAGALKMLASIDSKNMDTAIKGLTISLIAAVGVFHMLGKMSYTALKDAQVGVNSIINLSFAMLLMAGALKIMSKIPRDALFAGVAAITILMTVFAGLAYVMDKIAKQGTAVAKLAGTFMSIGASFFLIAFGIGIITASIYALSTIDTGMLQNAVDALIKVVLVLGMVVSGFAVISKYGDSGAAQQAAEAFAIMSLSLIIISFALRSVAKIGEGLDGAVKAISIIIGVMAAYLSLMIIIAKVTKMEYASSINQIAASMVIMAAGLIVLSIALSIVSSINSNALTNSIISIVTMLSALIVVFYAIYKIANEDQMKIMATAGSILALSEAILIISIALSLVAKLDPAGIILAAVAIGGLLVVFSVLAAVISKDSGQFLLGAAGIIILASAILIIAQAVVLLGEITGKEIGKAFALFGLLALLSAAAIALTMTGAILALLSLAIVIDLLGVGMLAFGTGLLSSSKAFAIFGETVENHAEAIFDFLDKLYLWVTEKLPLFAAAIGASFGILIAMAVASISAAVPLIVGSILLIITGVILGLSALVPVFMDTVADILDAIAESLPNLLVKINQFIDVVTKYLTDEALVKIASGLMSAMGKLSALIGIVLASLLELIAGILGKIKGMLMTFGAKVLVEIIITIIDTIFKTVKTFAEKLKDKFVEIRQFLSSGLTELKNEFLGLVDDVYKLLIDFLKGLADTIEENHEPLKEAAVRLAKVILKSFLSWFIGDEAASSLVETGSFIMSGIGKGLEKGFEAVKKTASWLGDKLKNGFENIFDIHSPSRWMSDHIGKNIDAGLAVGIEKYSNLCEDAAEDVGNNTKNAMSDAISKVTDFIQNDVDSTPTIRPILDLGDVEEGAKTIGELFNDGLIPTGRLGSISASMNSRINPYNNDDVVDAIDKLSMAMSGNSGNTYNINGITYDDGTAVSSAIKALVRATVVEGRV